MSTVFSTKVLTSDTIFTSPNGDRTAILRGHPSRTKVSACSAKGIPSFLSYFKTLSNSPASGNELPTSALLIAVNQHIALLCVLYESRGGSSDFRLPTSNFWPPTSDLRLHTSNFRLQTFTKWELWVSDFWPFRLKAEWLDLRTSRFPLPTSHFRFPTFDFPLPTSPFPLLTSDFRLPISHFWFPTSDFWLPTSEF